VEPAQPADPPPAPATPSPHAPAPPGAVPASARGGRSPRDMALSLAVLLVPIALLLAFYRGVLGGDAPIEVDPQPAIASAQSAHAFPVAVPIGLSADWHVTAATFRHADGGATLRLGYVDPDEDPVQLVQSSVPVTALLKAELGDTAAPGGAFRTGAHTWQRYDARPGEAALVLVDKGRTIIVVGATDPTNLEDLATALP
jgi:hypothetical protein